MGDPTLLAMVWQNLIANAIKFRAPGRAPVVRITVLGPARRDVAGLRRG